MGADRGERNEGSSRNLQGSKKEWTRGKHSTEGGGGDSPTSLRTELVGKKTLRIGSIMVLARRDGVVTDYI